MPFPKRFIWWTFFPFFFFYHAGRGGMVRVQAVVPSWGPVCYCSLDALLELLCSRMGSGWNTGVHCTVPVFNRIGLHCTELPFSNSLPG